MYVCVCVCVCVCVSLLPVKVWDSNWRLCCTFIGHREVVTSLSPYPNGPLIISGSLDSTLRVWDLTSHDQIEWYTTTLSVQYLHINPLKSGHTIWFSFISLSLPLTVSIVVCQWLVFTPHQALLTSSHTHTPS